MALIGEDTLNGILNGDSNIAAYMLLCRSKSSKFEFDGNQVSLADIYLFREVSGGALSVTLHPDQLALPTGVTLSSRTTGKIVVSTLRTNTIVKVSEGGSS